MPMRFPGMDPYLEQRGLWEEVHTALIVGIQQALAQLVQPHYRVAIERRVYLTLAETESGDLIGQPDLMIVSESYMREAVAEYRTTANPSEPIIVELPVPEEVIERYLEIRDAVTAEVITVIELLSPSNKISIQGRRQYEAKRSQVLVSLTHLVEIDLLRAGRSFQMDVPESYRQRLLQAHYRILISRATQRPQADAYLFSVRQPIPIVPTPLRTGEPEPALDLGSIIQEVYDRGRYDLAVDYSQPPPPPPFSAEDSNWLAAQLTEKSG